MPRRSLAACGRVLVGAIGSAVVLGEVASWAATRGTPLVRRNARCAVVVLGFPSTRRGTPSSVQRWRVRIGVRTLALVDDGWLIFSGGPTLGATESEADVMAQYAITNCGVDPALVEIEPRARTTWDNVRFSIELAEGGGAEQIAFASDPLHAWRTRRYLRRQRPELASLITRADDHRLLEHWWFKPLMLADVVRRLGR